MQTFQEMLNIAKRKDEEKMELKKRNAQIDDAVIEMGRDLNRDIIEELKEAQDFFTEEQYKALRKERNKMRINALGLKLIPGGKYND